MATFDRDQLRDKILGCRAGKNIGGTVGGPFEGFPEVNDLTFRLDQDIPIETLEKSLTIRHLRASYSE